MCRSAYDFHICGQLGERTDFQVCEFKVEALQKVLVAYGIYHHEHPLSFTTSEEECMIRQNDMACAAVSRIFDVVQIKFDCAACVAEAERLGGLEMALGSCGWKLRKTDDEK